MAEPKESPQQSTVEKEESTVEKVIDEVSNRIYDKKEEKLKKQVRYDPGLVQ